MNCTAVEKIIIHWLQSQLIRTKTNQKGFVIGISGGVDSALVSTLCAKTGHPTIVLSLPIHQAKDQLKRGQNHINWLKENFNNVDSEELDLTNAFENLKKSLNPIICDNPLSMANTRSRLRMTTLYAYAGHYKYLVTGTGNKIEDIGVKFFTKYGDGGVDLSPIGDLSKTQVWELAKHVGVSDEIIKAKPTDGLWSDNRGDEDSIGATYPELEWAMAYCEVNDIKYPMDANNYLNSNLSGREKQVLGIYLVKSFQGMHKMVPIPVCKIPQIIL